MKLFWAQTFLIQNVPCSYVFKVYSKMAPYPLSQLINNFFIHFVNLSCWLHKILTNTVDCPTGWQKTLITRMHWSILVYVRGYSHDANFNFCFTWQEWSLSFFLLIDSKRFQRGDLNKNENQIEVTLPGPPAPGATGLFHHIFVFILLLYSIVWKTHRRRSHVCAIFLACCAIFFASGHNFYFFFAFCCENLHISWM